MTAPAVETLTREQAARILAEAGPLLDQVDEGLAAMQEGLAVMNAIITLMPQVRR